MADIHDVSDYVINRLNSDGPSDLNTLKLQKLLYYIQAWNLAFYSKPIFDGKFQAWVHGPVNRKIYDLYKDGKFLYSSIGLADIKNTEASKNLGSKEILHIDSILDSYAQFSPSQLEYMTHREDPWISARQNVGQYQRSENEIDEKLMESYYKARLKS